MAETMDSKDLESHPKYKIYMLPIKFQKRRLGDMKASMLRKGFSFTDDFCPSVTHIVTEFDSLDQVENQLTKWGQVIPESAHVVSTSWLIACLKASSVVQVNHSYLLQRSVKTADSELPCSDLQNDALPEWACMRGAKLNHLNKRLTSAIEVLQEHAELRDGNQDYSRALAFRRASCVLKALPFTVQNISQLKGLRDIGDHVKDVIEDILDHGSSSEVDRISNSDEFRKLKLFTSVFGVGPSTAKSWIERDWTSIHDVCKSGCPSNDWRIAWGLAFFEELNLPVQKQEAEHFLECVKIEAQQILPGVIVTLVGGFRRGKSEGHDVDILLSHPTEGAEIGLLPKLLSALAKKDLILIGHKEKNSFRSDVLYQDFKLSMRGQLDHFEKWLGICKFPNYFFLSVKDKSSAIGLDLKSSKCDTGAESLVCRYEHSIEDSFEETYEPKVKKAKDDVDTFTPANKLAKTTREWKARRVDLIIAPHSQYYYALVGWTGSKHFNRDARLYAQKKLSLKLTSHGLFDISKSEAIAAKSEEEVFAHLKLPFLDPTERNC